MSGRGLGHTGGTLDKLESIPGFRVELSLDEFIAQVRDVGMAIIGQTADLVPADKKLYALRDVTATVDNVSLIAASIMSKKIAAGADAIVLDVKVGDGAFMKSLEDARILAEAMLDLGNARRPRRRLPAHRHGPAARSRGRERARDPRGDGDAARRGAAGLHGARARPPARGCSRSRTSASTRPRAGGVPRRRSPTDRPTAAYERWIRAQGGDPSEDALAARARRRARSRRRASGYVTRLGAIQVGVAALHLGAGRRTKEDTIDHSVGVVCRRKRGDEVGAGDVLAEVHARDEASAAEAVREVLAAYDIGDEQPPARSILLDVLSSAADGVAPPGRG